MNKGNQYFVDTNCPVCESNSFGLRFPIDIAYASRHSGINLGEVTVGVAICDRCSHQFIWPCPTPNFLKAFYDSYMSDAKGGFYHARLSSEIPKSFRDHYIPWLKTALQVLNIDAPRLLDVGCGLGMFLRLAQENGFNVIGIEPNSEAVERLKNEYSIPAYNLLLEDYFGEERFDVVTMWDLFEHLAQPKLALDKVFSILNPGGLLILEIPVRDCLVHWIAKGGYKLSFGKIRRPLFLTYGIHHLQYFSEKSITSFLQARGFEVIQSRREETNLGALSKKAQGMKSWLYNSVLQALFFLARIIGKQNKIVLVARKLV